jgi:putative NADH-flavin reductase
MRILIVGATGATGNRLVKQLLDRGHVVTVIIRAPEKFHQDIRNHKHISISTSTVLDLSHVDLTKQVEKCDAIVSCLGQAN